MILRMLWDLQADGNSMSDSRAMFSMVVGEVVCWRQCRRIMMIISRILDGRGD
jgi:hypothetical protein